MKAEFSIFHFPFVSVSLRFSIFRVHCKFSDNKTTSMEETIEGMRQPKPKSQYQKWPKLHCLTFT